MRKFKFGEDILLYLGLVGICVMIFFWIFALYTYSNQESNREAIIGSKVIVDQDTLLIVGYSFWSETYTLSNGLKIDVSFIDSTNLIK